MRTVSTETLVGHMVQLMPVPLNVSFASVKSRLVLPFLYRLTWVVPEKGPLNGCVCVCVCVCNRVIPIWNSLSNHVVSADTVNCFKNRLDKFWFNQEVLMYNHKADLMTPETAVY